MKTKLQIRKRLDSAELQLKELKAWHDKAYAKYQEERRTWGKDADRGEMDYASDLTSECEKEISILKWVLNLNNKPTVKFNTDEGDE